MYSNQQKLIIPNELDDLNKFISALRSHWSRGAKMKRDNTDIVRVECLAQKLKKVDAPCFIEYHFYCKNMKKDKDNIAAFGIKAINDGLQEAHILLQDSWKAIDGYQTFFYIDKVNPHIDVIISW